jgi:hypothetical protein
MALKKKRKGQRPAADEPHRPIVNQQHTTSDGHALPGIAGFHGIEQLPKNAMPLSRFTYRRPDGRPD